MYICAFSFTLPRSPCRIVYAEIFLKISSESFLTANQHNPITELLNINFRRPFLVGWRWKLPTPLQIDQIDYFFDADRFAGDCGDICALAEVYYFNCITDTRASHSPTLQTTWDALGNLQDECLLHRFLQYCHLFPVSFLYNCLSQEIDTLFFFQNTQHSFSMFCIPQMISVSYVRFSHTHKEANGFLYIYITPSLKHAYSPNLITFMSVIYFDTTTLISVNVHFMHTHTH